MHYHALGRFPKSMAYCDVVVEKYHKSSQLDKKSSVSREADSCGFSRYFVLLSFLISS